MHTTLLIYQPKLIFLRKKHGIRVLLFQKNLMLFIGKVLRNIRFSPHFYCCLQGVKFVMIETNSNFILSQQILIVLHKRLYVAPSFPKKISVLHRKGSQKHSLFTKFLLALRMGQVFNITNKYQVPNSHQKTFFSEAPV